MWAATSATNYKCIRVCVHARTHTRTHTQLENGDKVHTLIRRALDKHMLKHDETQLVLCQILADGREFQLPPNCNPYYAVVPPASASTSPMLNCLLRPKATLAHNRDSSATRRACGFAALSSAVAFLSLAGSYS